MFAVGQLLLPEAFAVAERTVTFTDHQGQPALAGTPIGVLVYGTVFRQLVVDARGTVSFATPPEGGRVSVRVSQPPDSPAAVSANASGGNGRH